MGLFGRIFSGLLTILTSTQVMADNWQDTLEAANGQEVYFNAWGGSSDINTYIQWAAKRVKEDYNVKLNHVLIDDTAVSVNRILTEQKNSMSGGSVDLIWVNGENFRTLKDNGALYAANSQLPLYAKVNTETLPTTVDFTIPVDNLEVPWGVAQLVFFYDSAHVSQPPNSADQLLQYAQANPGRVAYPRPPQFHGSSFLKQILIELVDDRSPLMESVDLADFAAISEPLWQYLDALHRVAWRKGEAFPKDASQMLQLVNDGELDIGFTFNPQEVATAINKGVLPATAKRYAFEIGALTNVHFAAIPANSDNKAAAKVVANFLISPEAQARKASTEHWGDPTVLAMDALDAGEAALFADEYRLYPGLAEPHPSWQVAIEEEWSKRYSQ